MSSAGQALPKNIFDLLEDILLVVFRVTLARLELFFRQRRGQMFERGALLFVDLLRGYGLHGEVQIPASSTRDIRHPFTAKTKDGARLCALGDFERIVAVERWHFNSAAECERCEVQRNLAR